MEIILPSSLSHEEKKILSKKDIPGTARKMNALIYDKSIFISEQMGEETEKHPTPISGKRYEEARFFPITMVPCQPKQGYMRMYM